jgi:hypothetical protein
MRLKNTSRYPEDEVRQLVAFGMRGVNTAGLAVNVKNAQNCAYRGRAYERVPLLSSRVTCSTVRRLVTIGLGEPERFPVSNFDPRKQHAYGGKRSPLIEYRDWREALVAVAAHEARHIQQFQRNRPRSEVDAERFAAKALDHYRKSQDV